MMNRLHVIFLCNQSRYLHIKKSCMPCVYEWVKFEWVTYEWVLRISHIRHSYTNKTHTNESHMSRIWIVVLEWVMLNWMSHNEKLILIQGLHTIFMCGKPWHTRRNESHITWVSHLCHTCCLVKTKLVPKSICVLVCKILPVFWDTRVSWSIGHVGHDSFVYYMTLWSQDKGRKD